MAQYSCRIYSNSGFNAVNIPDSPALLNQMAFADFPVLDLNQERFLPSVNVRANWDSVKNADYCRVGDFYYFVDSVYMSSGDTATLSLSPDFVTSAGGPAALDILDGLTERVHIVDDRFGLYDANDPYMAPAYDLDIKSYTHQFGSHANTFLETTLDLYAMGEDYINGNVKAVTAFDNSSGEEYHVTYPDVKYLDGAQSTQYKCMVGDTEVSLQNTQCQGVYMMGSGLPLFQQTIEAGVAQARALGIEQSISGQYVIPTDFVTLSNAFGRENLMTGNSRVITITGIPFIYGVAKNNRIWYGSQTPYVLASAAGDRLKANAEAIYNNSNAPGVRFIADPRRTGKPFFRFEVLNGQTSNGFDFFRDCVAGKQWNSVPLVLMEKSGGLLSQIQHDASVAQRELANAQATEMKQNEDIYRTVQQGFGTVLAGIGGVNEDGHMTIGPAAMISSAVNAGINDERAKDNWKRYQQSYALARQQEEQQFLISQNVNAPTISFPADPDLFVEATRNGFAVYRTVYKAADIARIDRILNAYGYQYTKVLDASDFSNRQFFNYVRASVSVGSLPRWWANGVSTQLSNGVRVWHVKPNHSYYGNNPVA